MDDVAIDLTRPGSVGSDVAAIDLTHPDLLGLPGFAVQCVYAWEYTRLCKKVRDRCTTRH